MKDTGQRFRKHIRMAQDADALTNASFAVVTLSLDGELLGVNPAAAEFFGTVEDAPVLSPRWQDVMQSLVDDSATRVNSSFERRIKSHENQTLVVAVWQHNDVVQVALRESLYRPHREGFKEAMLDVLALTGDEFFRSLVQTCAEYLEMNMVALVELSDDGEIARPIAMCLNGDLANNPADIITAGTPCQNVRDKGFTLYPDDVQTYFPDSEFLKDLCSVGYLGLPVRSRRGEVIALLWMTSRKPLTEDHIYRDTLLLIADRIASELERKDQLASLITENVQTRTILDNITDGIFITDTSGCLLHANPAMLQMVGYDLDTFTTLMVKDLIDPSDLAVQPADMRPILAGENVVYERRFIASDSSVFQAEVNIRLLPDNRIATVVRSLERRERDQKRLERSEARYRRIAESNMVPVFFWNMDGQIIDANDRFLKLLGYSRQSLARGDLTWQQTTTPEWQRIDKINTRLLRRDGSVEPYEKQLIHSEGHLISVFMGSAIYEGTNEGVSVLFDISELKATERILADSHTSVSTLIDNLPGIVFRAKASPDWPLTYVNESVKDFLGYSSDEFIHQGRFLNELIHPEDARQVREARQLAVDEQRQFQASYRLIKRDHEAIWVWEESRPVFDDKGRVVAIEGFIADNSERRSLDEQQMQSQKLDSIGRLAGGVGHDFNNLLKAVLEYSNEAIEKSEEHAQRDSLANIQSAAQRGMTLTRQLLRFARKQAIEPQVFSPNRRIKEIRKLLERLIGEDVELVLELNFEREQIKADPSQFEQVLVNLVTNARDAMPDGGLLKIRSAPVALGDAFVREHPEVRKGEYIRIDIEDTGCGITSMDMEKLFEPFFTTKENGTGLGLATCYGIVKQHLGHIEVSSAPEHGALFTLYFPKVTDSI
ncbi:PAS domain S-box protein [Planctomycetota bacterium]|nr:PAS domain S-box protein [Planctomycetota bacterium]